MRKLKLLALVVFLCGCNLGKDITQRTTDSWVTVECGGYRILYEKVISLENGLLLGINGNDSVLLPKCTVLRSYTSQNDTLFYTQKNGKKAIFAVSNRSEK